MSSNIFNDVLESSVGERLQNIQDLSITQDSVAVLQTNNQSISRPISYYAQNTLLSLNSDADIQTIANNQSPLGYSTIYVDNIEKLAENVNQDLNLKPKAENPVNTTIGLKSGITYWGTFVANADVQPRACAKIESGFYSGDAWQKQKLRFYVGYNTYDAGNIANYPGYDTSTLKMELDNFNQTTYVNIIPNVDNTLDLGYDSNNVGQSTTVGDAGDLWYRNSFIRNMYYQNLYEASDERLKTDIQPIPSALGSILKIQTKRYRYKNDTSKIRFGVIAQQIQTLFSDEYAIVNERNNMLSINYKEFVPLIIKSIQELARNRSKNIPDDVNVVEVPRQDPKDNNFMGSIIDRVLKLERLISAGANIVESVEEVISSNDNQTNLDDILVRLEKLENKHHHSDSDGESDGSFDMVAKLQTEIYELNQRFQKMESKVKRQTTLINKLAQSNLK